jgi:cell wall-associated NlpC family hydrolase
MRRPRPSTGALHFPLRPIRLLILLLAVSLALVMGLMRPLQSLATRPAKWHKTHAAKLAPPLVRFTPTRQLASYSPEKAFGHSVVAYARHFLGTPYRWGGSTPGGGFDCSGLVRFVYRRFGISLPHSTWGDLARGHRIPRSSLRPGDLVFFYGASHVGIYVGDGRFIDAPHTGARVRVSTMREYSYYGARRFKRG